MVGFPQSPPSTAPSPNTIPGSFRTLGFRLALKSKVSEPLIIHYNATLQMINNTLILPQSTPNIKQLSVRINLLRQRNHGLR